MLYNYLEIFILRLNRGNYRVKMGKTLAYIRASTNKQDLNQQKLQILEFGREHALKVDEYLEVTISSRKTSRQRRIDVLLEMLNPSDTLIVTELSRLGRSTAEVISLVNELMEQNIRLIILKQNLDLSNHDMNSKIIITLFSLFDELERDLISIRTKEALATKKKQGLALGKPNGTIQKSKFDEHKDKIIECLNLGLSIRKIAKLLGYNNHIGLNTYIKKRNLRKIIRNA